MNNILSISDKQFARAIDDLGRYVAIPSVSNPHSPDYDKRHLQAGADFASKELRDLDFEVTQICIEDAPPFVIAERIVDVAKPTLLLYAHYDVQPVDRSKWLTDPFVMVERDGRIYGRGASDDKAGVMGIIAALRVYKESDTPLPVNIKVLFEGEEEYGSAHMGKLLEQEARRLHADAMVILDTLNRDVETGTLDTSTRGLVNLSLTVSALQKPVHSGIVCLAPDPAQTLAALVHSLANPREIPGFMDGFTPLSDVEREILRKETQTAESYGSEAGVLPGCKLRGDASVSIYERIVEEPSVSVVNMTSGQPNGGNSIQSVAQATIGVRVLPGQNPDAVGKAVIDYVRAQPNPYNLHIDIQQREHGAWAWKAQLDRPFSQAYFQAMAENFKHTCAMPCGGALPLMKQFEDAFPSIEIIGPGMEDPQTAAHSHNESQHLGVMRNAINSLINFIARSGDVQKHNDEVEASPEACSSCEELEVVADAPALAVE